MDRKLWSSITGRIRSNRNSTTIRCQITRALGRRPHDGRSARFFQFGECKTRPGHVMVMTRAQFWLRPGGAQGRGRTKNTPPPFVRSPRWNCYNYSDGFVRSPLPLGPWPFQFIPNGRQTHTNASPTFWFCFFLFLCFCLVFMPGFVSGDMSFKSCCFQWCSCMVVLVNILVAVFT